MVVVLASTAVGCAAQPAVRAETALLTSEPVTAKPTTASTDYLVVTPPAFAQALAPLVEHRRAQGHRVKIVSRAFASADAIRSVIRAEHARSGAELRYVLLAGDAASEWDRREGHPDRLPTFYLKKLRYGGGNGAYAHRGVYPSDAPFAEIDGEIALAVGRVPVRSARETEQFVAKLLRYETTAVTNPWPRRLVLRAGTADFGAMTDRAIERAALGLLNDSVPYDFDLHVTFAKEGSHYANRPDQLQLSLQQDAARGALFFAYVGHSGRSSFQSMAFRGWRYSLGKSDDFASMVITEGAPVFLSLACDAGAFDMDEGRRSISEEAVLNPQGPIAAFASSRVSHPYPNFLYGEAFIESFLVKRPPTLGEGLVAMKKDMLAGFDLIGEMLSKTDTDDLKTEHVGLYNLLGDPATRLRYPEALKLDVSGEAQPGQPIRVRVQSPVAGDAIVTLETQRSVIAHDLTDVSSLPDGEALRKMADNHRLANDKRLQEKRVVIDARVEVTMVVPEAPGHYVVKAFVTSRDGQRFASGHLRMKTTR